MNNYIYYGLLLLGLGISILGSTIGISLVFVLGMSLIAGCTGYSMGWYKHEAETEALGDKK